MRSVLTTTLMCLSAAAFGQTASAPPAGAPALGRRYVSMLNGFSLCPPAGAERVRTTSRRRVAAWTRREPDSGAIRYSLEVLRTLQEPTKLPMDQYAAKVAAGLLVTSRVKVESTRLGTVAGAAAMHFRGRTAGELNLWCRQTWVKIRPGKSASGPEDKAAADQYLLFNLTGPAKDKAGLDALMTACLATLKLFDPEAARQRSADNLANGAKALEGWTDAKLRPLLSAKPAYYVLFSQGQAIGFLRVTERIGRPFGDATGLSVVRWGCLKAPDEPRRLICEELFCTADRRVEQWRHMVATGEGRQVRRTFQEGIKQGNVLLVGSRGPGQPATSTKHVIPEAIGPAYMPAAMAAIAPQLIDRSDWRSYGFAVFNPLAGTFDLRTVGVVGTDKLKTANGQVQATRLTDQKADDAPVVQEWVDPTGRLLHTRSPDGVVIQRSDQEAVVKAFAPELVELERLSRRVGRF